MYKLSEFSQSGHIYVNNIQIRKQNLTGTIEFPHQVPSTHFPQGSKYHVF